MSSPNVETYTIPDILLKFPWPRNLSEHFAQAKAESKAWTEAFHFFDEDGLKGFNLCDFNLLASLSYSPRDYEIIRLGCDMMNLFYVFDEYTDIEDGPGAAKIHEIVMDAFRNPERPRPEGELLIGEMTRDFWLRCSSIVPPGSPCLKHMIDTWHTYTAAVAVEADDRCQRLYRDFEGYLELRRDTSGCLPSFALHEFGLDLPEEAYHHPMMEEIRDQANLLISLGNDIGSYALEKERGLDTHNSVALIMQECNLDLQGSIKWLEDYAMELLDGFLENIKNFPSYGEDVDRRIKIYFDGIAQWVRGNDDWTYESGRYFGDKGLIIKKTRTMCFSPPPSGFVQKSA